MRLGNYVIKDYYCCSIKIAVQIKKMLVERGAKDLAGGVWSAIIARFSPPSVPQSDYPPDLRGHEKLFTDYGISLKGVEPKKDGMTVFDTGHGELIIDWGKRVIKPPLGHHSSLSPMPKI